MQVHHEKGANFMTALNDRFYWVTFKNVLTGEVKTVLKIDEEVERMHRDILNYVILDVTKEVVKRAQS